MTVQEKNDLTIWCNSQRAWYGVSPQLTRDWRLDAMAQEQADRMAAANTLYHHEALNWLLTVGWIRVAENVAYAWDAWGVHVVMSNSPAHLNNMNGPYQCIGVGTARGPGGQLFVSEIYGAYM